MKKLSWWLLLIVPVFAAAQYTVSIKNIKCPVPSSLWGLFFEDINRGADGGLYAEMVENRGFDFPKPMTGWETWPAKKLRDGVFVVTNQSAENPANPKFMSVVLQQGDTVGLINTGFDEGMVFKKGSTYQFTLRYRQLEAGIHSRVFLFNSKNRMIGNTELPRMAAEGLGWHEVQVNIVPKDSSAGAKLLVIFEGAGKMDVDRISLFPTDTWNNRPGGLRKDLVQQLYDLHPGFLRFPGGCIVEGKDLNYRYQWKNTIGPVDQRKLVQSIWNDDVPGRQTPDYFESNGLGFYEYFQLCEDIGAAPLPILNCGMSCQFDAAEVVPLADLDPYVQDALDLIEFANGDASTKWGAVRISLGHALPFNMKMLGVGNENWGPQYADRLAVFTRAIKEKYPYMQLVNATGYSRNIPVFTYMDSVLRARHADIIDEHFYDTPAWFMNNADRYDSYDRKGPKIFVGEYAAQSDRIGSPDNKNNLLTALAEACFMTGIERNADVVSMASYAPLFAHVTGWQWTPNLIWFDNSSSYRTPNYYVQQLFSLNKGTDLVSISEKNKPISGADSVWASAVIDKNTNELIIKLVNPSALANQRTIAIPGLQKPTATGTRTILSGSNPAEMNSLDKPLQVKPMEMPLIIKNKAISILLDPYSFNVIRIQL